MKQRPSEPTGSDDEDEDEEVRDSQHCPPKGSLVDRAFRMKFRFEERQMLFTLTRFQTMKLEAIPRTVNQGSPRTAAVDGRQHRVQSFRSVVGIRPGCLPHCVGMVTL